jgi:putative colanic acid biosynthesis glycosyltransferase WcaI
LNERSVIARLFEWMLRYSLKHAAHTIVLDRFMRERVLEKGAEPERVSVISPWSHDDAVCFSVEGREAFRLQHGLTDRFVVMYSGNHSPCHPLDTLLDAARELKARDDIAFCFVGGGSEHAKVKDFASRHQLRNVKCLPYQPLRDLSSSLSAADLHVVVMGDEFVGIVHPCKIYNIISVGVPTLYIGPTPSHVTDLASQNLAAEVWLAAHGDVGGVASSIMQARRLTCNDKGKGICSKHSGDFSKQQLLPQLISVIGGDSFENLFRPVPDSDNRLTDYHAAH